MKETDAKSVLPGMNSWLGEAVDIFKETENGIPTGRMSILWKAENGDHTISSYEPNETVSLLEFPL